VSLYVDASAMLKLYIEEPESQRARELLRDPIHWTTARHTRIEVRRNIARVVDEPDLTTFRSWFEDHWADTTVVELTDVVCERAAELVERVGVRTLDALHLGAAAEAGEGRLPIVTFDRRLSEAARSLGWTVLGAE
jgi:predicted nucleic acid-binding protein